MSAGEDFLILRPFNALFLILFAVFILVLVFASLLLRGKSEKTRGAVLIAACVCTCVGFFFYKLALSRDADYNVITANMGGFNWWGEMPLQLCNINMILIPIAVWRKSRPLMSFSFFLGPLGALMALVMPGNGFSGYSVLLPRMMGYYGTHFMIVIEGLALAAFGLYRPRFRDFPRTLLAAVLIAFGVFLVNVLLRVSGLHPKANYFFSMETEGNALLELFHRIIPLPFLYLLLSVFILVPYMALVTLPFALADRRKNGETERRN